MTALASTNSSCLGQNRPLVREGVPHQQIRDGLTVIKIWSWAPDGSLTPRQTGRLTVGSNITLTSTLSSSSPAGLMTMLCCLRFETPQSWTARSQYLYPPETGWLSYTPRHRVPFSSPPTTRRATEKIFETASNVDLRVVLIPLPPL
jgi:hypothetical protein